MRRTIDTQAGIAAVFNVHVHEELSLEPHHLAQHIDISALIGEPDQGRIEVGHRVSFKVGAW